MRRWSGSMLLVALLATSAAAQERWSWPENPENLTELEGFTGRQLAPVMRGFSQALGVRCWYCHVGEEGAPLSTYDFVSDDRPAKNTAREMLRMLGSVNEHLEKIEPSGSERVNMWCHTCHRGRPRPTTLEEELKEAYAEGGVTAAVERHDALRDRYYGHGTLAFDEAALNVIGYQALGEEDVSSAITAFRANVERYPDAWNAWDSLAEAYMTSGERELAIVYYQKSLVIEPSNRNAREMLERLGAFGEAPAPSENAPD